MGKLCCGINPLPPMGLAMLISKNILVSAAVADPPPYWPKL
jgi:hypothetical protein